MMNPQIVEFGGIRLAAVEGKMSFASDLTASLWRELSRITRQFPGSFAGDRYSVSEYESGFFRDFDPRRSFRKRAATPVLHDRLPTNLLTWLEIPAGRYAVFEYCGSASGGEDFFRAIFSGWLPESGFELDSRPHFEILPPGYDPKDPQAREWVYIPVKAG